MEAYSYSSSSSNTSKVPYYSSSLHSVKKAATAKPWKKLVAPLPPNPPRVYRVDPINFRDLVQKLTAAPEFQLDPPQQPQPQPQLRLQSLAPPPVQAVGQVHRPVPEKAASLSTVYKEFSEVLQYEKKPNQNNNNNNKLGSADINNVVGSSFLGLNSSSISSSSISLSPSTNSHNWCSFLLSPGTLSSLGQSTVL
ncbi:uncharacterized protein LOC115712459 [Cannabis sativa]|uniref:VQ domain-containing protein n=1 Tax=Cannabis sativa TaxID=3483 RepID=A0A7J6FZD7_CANSA|nr:uncharacterized protein LOC115712459 [Cannabis sativa]KAF4375170.1 hypothetical protein F8388_017316 [Cannabis sativa]KAF4402061.1 hypothetical protein G4B88_017573 [Cannabis sativa]